MFQTIPDFHAAMQDLLGSDVDGDDQFKAFLATLADENGYLENLCLLLQVALLLSPIFLLQEAQIHLSKFYVQRFKLAIVCLTVNYSYLTSNDCYYIVFKSTWK